jgi:hypothetical protein
MNDDNNTVEASLKQLAAEKHAEAKRDRIEAEHFLSMMTRAFDKGERIKLIREDSKNGLRFVIDGRAIHKAPPAMEKLTMDEIEKDILKHLSGAFLRLMEQERNWLAAWRDKE